MRRLLSIAFALLALAVAIYGQNRPVRILSQPKPEPPKYYGTLDVQATIRLSVEFLADGTIGKIVPISGMPASDLIGLAVEAARKIRFRPRQLNGKSVDSLKTVQYLYSWDGFWKVPKQR